MTYVNQSGSPLALYTVSGGDSPESWFEALAQAWGQALNKEANLISSLSQQLNTSGGDQPSVETQLTAESQRMTFLANSEASSVNGVGDALQAVARKQ